MSTFRTFVPLDMTRWSLVGLADAVAEDRTSTSYTLRLASGLDGRPEVVSVIGKGFTFDAQGHQTGGHIDGLTFADPAGRPLWEFTGQGYFDGSAYGYLNEPDGVLTGFNATGSAQDDVFKVGEAATRIDGGDGYDRLVATALVSGRAFYAHDLRNIEEFDLRGFTVVDLTGTPSGPGRPLLINGSGSGQLFMQLGDQVAGSEHLTVIGSHNDDQFFPGLQFGSDDHIDGGQGNDRVFFLDNTKPVDMTLGPDSLKSIELIGVAGAGSNALTLDDGNVAAGGHLSIFGGNAESRIDGSAETDGRLSITTSDQADVVIGGAGNDRLFTMGGDDHLTGGLGADVLTGGDGWDTFDFRTPGCSTLAAHDWITDFNALKDRLEIGGDVTGLDHQLTVDSLSDAGTALQDWLQPHHALVLESRAHHETYLVVDLNGAPGFQDGADLIVRIDGATHLDALSVHDFVL